jgi:type IV pilus assembly protein PilM
MAFVDTIRQLFKKGGVELPQLTSKHEGALGVDIGTSSIKIVQLHNNQGVVTLDTYGEIALGPLGGNEVGQSTNLSPEQISGALRDVYEASQAQATSAGVCVPFSASLVKLIELPPLEDRKLATVIPIEARRYIPVPIDQVQLDYFIVPETEQRLFEQGAVNTPTSTATTMSDDTPLSRKLVLIVAIHDHALQRLGNVFQKTLLRPAFFELEVFSAVRATIPRGLAPVVIFDIGAATTKMYLVEMGIVLASHVVPIGAQNVTHSIAKSLRVSMGKAEELKRAVGLVGGVEDEQARKVAHVAELTMEHVFAEAKRVLIGFERRYNKVVTKGVLVGGGAAMKGVERFAEERLDMEMQIGAPFDHIDTPAFLSEAVAEVGPVFAVAAGAALRALKT